MSAEPLRKAISPRTEEAIIDDLLRQEADESKNTLESRLDRVMIISRVFSLIFNTSGKKPSSKRLTNLQVAFEQTSGETPERITNAGNEFRKLLSRWRKDRPTSLTPEDKIIISDALEFSLLPAIASFQSSLANVPQKLVSMMVESDTMPHDIAGLKEAALLLFELCEKTGRALPAHIRHRINALDDRTPHL